MGGHHNDDVIVGPDLNPSRTPLDKKLYRQIIIKKNGLRVILVSDTVAMVHQDNFEYDSESEAMNLSTRKRTITIMIRMKKGVTVMVMMMTRARMDL